MTEDTVLGYVDRFAAWMKVSKWRIFFVSALTLFILITIALGSCMFSVAWFQGLSGFVQGIVLVAGISIAITGYFVYTDDR